MNLRASSASAVWRYCYSWKDIKRYRNSNKDKSKAGQFNSQYFTYFDKMIYINKNICIYKDILIKKKFI